MQAVNNLDGSQRGWNTTQSAISVGLPLVAVGAKPTAMWLASGLENAYENGIRIGGFKIIDPNVYKMYAVPPGGGNSSARFGNAVSNDYRATFFAANPELQGKVVVHHAVEQQVLNKFPGVVTEAEIHSLENLRGIPYEINNTVHLSDIRVEWNRFYKPFVASGTTPTQTQLLQKATEIDLKFGSQFNPPIGGK
jgi:hypothetical protein